MEDAPPPSEPRSERRALAAIVFTDVVGFSRRAAADEARTYAAMNRDFARFDAICAEHGGRVANTAGDSMLLVFDSAVDAMRCALAIQRALYDGARALPLGDVLEHRIGAHIGDVIHDGRNAFGDGVNVASRIQEICRPGAIAYSRAVSEIVTGKVALNGVYLGPRRAKNIGDAIPVWEVPPIVDPERERLHAELLAPLAASSASDGLSGRRGAAVLALAVVLLAAGFAIMTTIRLSATPNVARATSGHGVRTARGPATNAPANAGAPTNAATENPAANAGPNSSEGDTPQVAPGTEETRRRLEALRSAYDFDGLVALLERARDEPNPPDLGGATIAAALERYRLLSALRIWADAEIRTIPAAAPMELGDGTAVDLSSGAPAIRGNDGRTVPFELWALSPARLFGVMAALEARLDRGSPPPSGALVEFAAEYGLNAPAS